MVMIGMGAHAGLPYLPLVGPPPMRVAAAKPSPVSSVIALEKSAANSVTNVPPVLETVAATNILIPETNAPVEMLALPSGPVDPTFGPSVFNSTEPGMVNLTPQMLATYFRPVVMGTNTAIIGGVLPIGFVPPFTRPESSHAEYIVK